MGADNGSMNRSAPAGDTLRPHGVVPVEHGLGDSVALWRIDLDAFPVGHEAPTTGRRLLAAHSALRTILAETLDCDPAELRIERDPMGRPVLADHALSFNLSTSRGHGLVGLATDARIGVDLEVLRPVTAAAGIAAEHFSSGELDLWRDVAAGGRDRCFLRCWTRKEACAKSLGVGLRIPPAAIDAGCEAAARHAEIPLRGGVARCLVTSVDPGPHLLGAVALASAGAARLAVASV